MTTKAEAAWMDAITQFGCCVCRNQGRGYVPAEIHHVLRSGRRIDHLHSIPLCPTHHRNAPPVPGEIARHPFKARFEAAYGTELELLSQMQNLLREVA